MQDKTGVGDRLPADLVERILHGAGAVRGEKQTFVAPRRLVVRRGLLRKDVGRRTKTPALDLAQELGEIDHAGAAHQQEDRARRDHLELAFPKKPWFSLVTEANTTMTWLVLNTSSSDAAATPKAGHEMIGNPRIVGLDLATERLKQGNERAREIAEADQADAAP